MMSGRHTLLLHGAQRQFLRRKARDGQCYNHNQPCPAAEEEVVVYRACLTPGQTLLERAEIEGD